MRAKLPAVLLVLFVLFILSITILANNNLLWTGIKVIPFYDSIGHFLLFGMLGLLAHYGCNQKSILLLGISVPIGPALAVLYATVDEILQIFSPYRSFDLGDLFFGILGIILFYIFATWIKNK